MTDFKRVLFLKSIIDILKEANCDFTFDYRYQKIKTLGGDDITPHLFAMFKRIDDIKDEYWREKFAKSFGIPFDMLFPTKEKIDKYNFIHDKKPKVYISGPITGLSEKVYKNNFNSTELYLTGLGYDVINPVSYPTNPEWKWEDYMKRDIKLLCDCDYIYLLEGWQASDGASLEYVIAKNLGIKTLTLDDNGKVL